MQYRHLFYGSMAYLSCGLLKQIDIFCQKYDKTLAKECILT